MFINSDGEKARLSAAELLRAAGERKRRLRLQRGFF